MPAAEALAGLFPTQAGFECRRGGWSNCANGGHISAELNARIDDGLHEVRQHGHANVEQGDTSTQPCASGRSRVTTDCTSSDPIPGQENTTSTSAAALSR